MYRSYQSGTKEYNEILAYIQRGGGYYKEWYVGITMDAKNRLFTEHFVDQVKDQWIYFELSSNQIARQIEVEFFKLGCDGGPGGGDLLSRYVYAYRKSARTKP